ncbi:xyloglucan glycosyltransferase 4 [Senna tora]|uniref:Xyloglucan glycosyltransferase 4 n=1 Tax=Senna tora TaxID=362788 RepID=A0A834SRG9_9FABA|nr:xyloglucan glycosyltransferase 4 [Senna tora]
MGDGECEATEKAKWDDRNTVEEIVAGNRPYAHTLLERENSEYLKFKHEGPKHLDLLEACYKDVIASGYSTLAPYEDPSLDEGGNNNDDNASGGGIAFGGKGGGNYKEIDEGVENIVEIQRENQMALNPVPLMTAIKKNDFSSLLVVEDLGSSQFLADRPKRFTSPKQFTWVLLLKLHKVITCFSWLATASKATFTLVKKHISLSSHHHVSDEDSINHRGAPAEDHELTMNSLEIGERGQFQKGEWNGIASVFEHLKHCAS